jgi:hypothetical protein
LGNFAVLRYLLVACCLSPCCSWAAEKSIKVAIGAGEVARENSPVAVLVTLPKDASEAAEVIVTGPDGKQQPGQLTRPGLLVQPLAAADDQFVGELHFIVPKLAAGESATFTASIGKTREETPASFKWVDTSKAKGDKDEYAEQSRELRFGTRPVLRYMYSQLDESTKEARSATFKPYHHMYDPAGQRLVTKGPGGLFPHHRGIFYGWNKITYGPDGKQQADVWHCNNGEYQEHAEVLSEEAGPVLGRQRVKINWRGRDKQVFAVETRELTAYNTAGGILVEFASVLTNPADDPIKLAGDPQHAGFQFRASQEVPDKTKDQTYYLRPDGKGEPGKFRNWPDDKGHVNLPWHALSFVLGDQRYTCCYLDRPENPKESRFSERDYGRFGSYFEYELRKDKPLRVNYRLWLQAGEMTGEQVQHLDDDFVQGAAARVK